MLRKVKRKALPEKPEGHFYFLQNRIDGAQNFTAKSSLIGQIFTSGKEITDPFFRFSFDSEWFNLPDRPQVSPYSKTKYG